MMITFSELKDKLKQVNEVDLLELLDLSSEELVEQFADRIEDNFEQLSQEFQDSDEIFYNEDQT